MKHGLAEKARKGFQGARSACVEFSVIKGHRILGKSEIASGRSRGCGRMWQELRLER